MVTVFDRRSLFDSLDNTLAIRFVFLRKLITLHVEKLSCFGSISGKVGWLLKCLIRAAVSLRHSMRRCFTVTGVLHLSHSGGSDWPCIRYECVMLVWPNLRRDSTFSTLLFLFSEDFYFLMSFFISLSFLPSWFNEFQYRCQCSNTASLTTRFMLECNIALGGSWSSCIAASFAAESALSFPAMPMWLGTQQKSMVVRLSALFISSLIS